jgi:hexosaminidase
MHRFITILVAFITLQVFAQCPIIPTPKGYQTSDNKIYLKDKLSVDFTSLDEEMATYFSDGFKKVTGMDVVIGEETTDLRFEEIKIDFRHPIPGFYAITYSKLDKVIRFKDPASQLYGIVSFLQLLEKDDNGWFIRECEIGDVPRFEWRGLHLDVSRHFFTVDEVKRFIDMMALYKFNKFHWHLTDDQGWRIEIKKYPLLTEIGGFRDSTVIGHYSDSPRTYDKTKYGGFYTQEEIKEVVAYANSRYIDVVPEIEMPGHSRAALAAYPELSCTGEKMPVPGLWGIFDDIYCSKDESIDFMKDVLSEVIELFPGEFIHIGGDEAPKTRWKECDDCQRVIKEKDLHDEHELQSYFIRQIDKFLTSKGKKLIGWDEILEGGLSPNAAVMSWRGEQGGIEAAKQDHEVVMTPTTYCYFDYYQSATGKEPLAIGGYLPLEKAYKFNPIPEELPEDKEKYILGGQANLWTEYIPSLDHLEYMTYPRALALAQSVWCSYKPSYDQFLEVVTKYQEGFMDAFDINYSKAIHYPKLNIDRVEDGVGVSFSGTSAVDSFYIDFRTYVSTVEVPSKFEKGYYSATDTFVVRTGGRILPKYSEYYFYVHIDDEILTYKVDNHSALGADIVMITKPHPKYDHNGSLNLVDGRFRGDRFSGTDWLGFRESKIEFIVKHKIDTAYQTINIGFLDNNGSWIYYPKEVSVQTSMDGETWYDVSSTSKMDEYVSLFCGDRKAEYVKVIIETMNKIPDGMPGEGNIPWTFIDEVYFIPVIR